MKPMNRILCAVLFAVGACVLALAGTPALAGAPDPERIDESTICTYDGDVNRSGVITAGDAQQSFSIMLGLGTPTFRQRCSADCNADGLVTAGDSQLIFSAALSMAECDNGCGPDAYEEDDDATSAMLLEPEMVQLHSICPAGDQDWWTFTLSEPSYVMLDTAGPAGDTVMELRDAGLNVIASDQSGNEDFSQVAADVLAGTYYVMVAQFGDNDPIFEYDLTLIVSAPPIELPPVDLATLSTFVAVAGAGLTNSNSGGTTTLNGDVGLSPTAMCLGDGAPCTATNPVINGTLYANDPEGVAAQAQVDLTAAYVDATARPVGTPVNDISGMVLPPGVYTSDSTMSIAVGATVILDGQGDANAVWIFQIGSSLTVNNNAQVLLINGAMAKNVFWAVFASSTLGTNVSFQGSILAGASNSVGTGSVVLGRLLCMTGAITLLSNTITLPPF